MVPDGYALELDESFRGPLNASTWLPYYLPHWSSRSQGAARYRFSEEGLVLRIDADQEPWCAEFDGTNRTSTLQTGEFAGPLGSRTGQSRFRDDLVVREEQESRLLYGMHHGYVELRCRGTAHPDAMFALWMIGHEASPERSGEICVAEIFGRDLDGGTAAVGMGVHPFGDPALTDEFEKVPARLDVTEFHVYAAHWRPGTVDFFIDGSLVKTVGQAPDYPLQLMLGIFDFPTEKSAPVDYPKEFVVDHLRVYS
ncbi:MAG: glycoside hydrolase family 16 protein [Kribbellaceae bacterium]